MGYMQLVKGVNRFDITTLKALAFDVAEFSGRPIHASQRSDVKRSGSDTSPSPELKRGGPERGRPSCTRDHCGLARRAKRVL